MFVHKSVLLDFHSPMKSLTVNFGAFYKITTAFRFFLHASTLGTSLGSIVVDIGELFDDTRFLVICHPGQQYILLSFVFVSLCVKFQVK